MVLENKTTNLANNAFRDIGKVKTGSSGLLNSMNSSKAVKSGGSFKLPPISPPKSVGSFKNFFKPSEVTPIDDEDEKLGGEKEEEEEEEGKDGEILSDHVQRMKSVGLDPYNPMSYLVTSKMKEWKGRSLLKLALRKMDSESERKNEGSDEHIVHHHHFPKSHHHHHSHPHPTSDPDHDGKEGEVHQKEDEDMEDTLSQISTSDSSQDISLDGIKNEFSKEVERLLLPLIQKIDKIENRLEEIKKS